MNASRRRTDPLRRALLSLAIALGLLTGSTASWAQPDPTEAEQLFQEGRQLLKEGQLEQACSKLAESQRLDPSSGTLMNLAHCHQEQGKLATAYSEFSAAAGLAAAQNVPHREAEARRRADALLPRLSYLVVRVAKPDPLLEIVRNGTRMEADALNHAIPVDPGAHEIRATAPEHTEWKLTITITQPGQHVVEVPELALRGAPIQPNASTPTAPNLERPVRSTPVHRADAPAPADKGLPAAFWVAAGSSVLATGVATAAGVMSLTNYGKAEEHCPVRTECNPDGMAAWGDAQTQATIANVAVGTAVVAAGVGVYFFMTSRGARSNATTQGTYRRGALGRVSSQPVLGWSW